MPTSHFSSEPAVKQHCPLLLGLVGPSASGKTFSALRMATGIADVYNGRIYFVDTEGGRAKHYAPEPGKEADPATGTFNFQHVPFQAPYSSDRYKEAIQYCHSQGAAVCIIDNMSHEHTGEGGFLDTHDQFLAKYDNNPKYNASAWGAATPGRRRLREYLVTIGGEMAVIMCYRGKNKLDWNSGGSPKQKGISPDTTSEFIYECCAQFLLRTGSEGIPDFDGETPEERALIKGKAQFAHWFEGGRQLDEAMGRRFAEWARGDTVSRYDEAVDVLQSADTLDELRTVWQGIGAEKKRYSGAEFARLAELKDARKEALSNAK